MRSGENVVLLRLDLRPNGEDLNASWDLSQRAVIASLDKGASLPTSVTKAVATNGARQEPIIVGGISLRRVFDCDWMLGRKDAC